MEFIRTNAISQDTNSTLDQQVLGDQEYTKQIEEDYNEEPRNQDEKMIPQPLAVIFPKEVERE